MKLSETNTLAVILDSAKQEFLEKGYPKASLREITKKAGVTTGALYGYFRNKEELFEALVAEHYHKLLDTYRDTLDRFSALPAQDQVTKMPEYTAECVRRMCDYMYLYHDAFKLILCCSEGTPYNNLIHEMAHLDVEATHDFAQTSEETGKQLNPINPTLEHMLTSGMFSTFFELIIHDIPREEADEYIRQLLAFYTGGWQNIMGF